MITSRKGGIGRYFLFLGLCMVLIVYFSYHAVNGNHGLHKQALLTEKIKQLETELAALKEERQRIDHDVLLITKRVQTDPDLLEEQSRSLLNFVRPGDIVVLRPQALSGNK